MLKILSFLSAMALSVKAFANPACAVCTVAVCTSLSIATKLGIGTEAVGVWAGAMLAIFGYWAIRWFDKKKWTFPHRDALLMIISLASIGFVYMGELVYSPTMFLGFLYIDPFLFATLVGALTLIGSMNFYEWMKARNGGHAHFPFEKVVIPVLAVFFVSLIFHYDPQFCCMGGM